MDSKRKCDRAGGVGVFWNIDRKCPFSKCSRCTACNVLSIECDGRNYVFCEQFRIVTSVKEQEAR